MKTTINGAEGPDLDEGAIRARLDAVLGHAQTPTGTLMAHTLHDLFLVEVSEAGRRAAFDAWAALDDTAFPHLLHACLHNHKACRQDRGTLPRDLRVGRLHRDRYGLGDKISEMDAATEDIPALMTTGMGDAAHRVSTFPRVSPLCVPVM